VKQSRPELRFLGEREFERVAELAGRYGDLLRVAVATGVRFGEITALRVGDVDPEHRTIRVNKAWKRDGEDGEGDTPGWLTKQLTPKHTMREHHLGNPKTPKSRRTITVSPAVAEVLRDAVSGKASDDFVFATRTGRPLHNSDSSYDFWRLLMRQAISEGIAPFRFHDLRHTHVAWLVAGGAPLPHIQARLGHESITTTIDTYGHLLPAGDELISSIIDTALTGGTIRPGSNGARTIGKRKGAKHKARGHQSNGDVWQRPSSSQAAATAVHACRANRSKDLRGSEDGLFAGFDEFVEVFGSEPDVRADSGAADLSLADGVGDPAGGDVEVGGRLGDRQQGLLALLGRIGLGAGGRGHRVLPGQRRTSPTVM
jgi:hypothetical protein